jgi:glycolate oxidase FAD binding subunit
VRGRGRVVKNAAGFDLPKLMVGSLGTLGILVEVSVKVLPRPAAWATVRRRLETRAAASADAASPVLVAALDILRRVRSLPIDLDAFDIDVRPDAVTIAARIAALESPATARIERLRNAMGGGDLVEGRDEAATWRDAREFRWVPGGWSLVKVPVTPGRIPAFDAALAGLAAPGSVPVLRRYSALGQVAWAAFPARADALDSPLAALDLAGLAVRGPSARPRLGARTGAVLEQRVKSALDPLGRFGDA